MNEREYVLGTRDEEIERLGLQHRVWRPRMLDAWRRAGIGPGAKVADIGAGPGFAALDLAEIVGPTGEVTAFEMSPRFTDALERSAAERGLDNVRVRRQDVSGNGLGEAAFDFAWCRWLLSFVPDPAAVVGGIAAALKPGGTAIFHEYLDYGAWRTLPPDPDLERFRDLVIRSWREAGGEPDVGLHLPSWLAASGLEIVEARPMIEIVAPGDFAWQWPRAFMATNSRRLRELGYAGEEEAERFARALDDPGPGALMVTPLVLEAIARKQ